MLLFQHLQVEDGTNTLSRSPLFGVGCRSSIWLAVPHHRLSFEKHKEVL